VAHDLGPSDWRERQSEFAPTRMLKEAFARVFIQMWTIITD